MSEDPNDTWVPGSDLYKIVSVEDWYWEPDVVARQLPWGEIRSRVDQYRRLLGRFTDDLEEEQRAALDKLLDDAQDGLHEAFLYWLRDRKPWLLRVNSWCSWIGLRGPLAKRAGLWYYGIAWEFKSWRNRLWDRYVEVKEERLETRLEKAYQDRDEQIDEAMESHRAETGEKIGGGVRLDIGKLNTAISEMSREHDALMAVAWQLDDNWPDYYENDRLLARWLELMV